MHRQRGLLHKPFTERDCTLTSHSAVTFFDAVILAVLFLLGCCCLGIGLVPLFGLCFGGEPCQLVIAGSVERLNCSRTAPMSWLMPQHKPLQMGFLSCRFKRGDRGKSEPTNPPSLSPSHS